MKILVEVKGRYSFPRDFLRISKFEQAFSQLTQEAALARTSEYWHTELLIALAKLDMWYLFQITDSSDDECVRFTITNSWVHYIDIPYIKEEHVCNTEDIRELITFLCSYRID